MYMPCISKKSNLFHAHFGFLLQFFRTEKLLPIPAYKASTDSTKSSTGTYDILCIGVFL